MARRTDKLIETVYLNEFKTEYALYLTPDNRFRAVWKPAKNTAVHLATEDTADRCRNVAYGKISELCAVKWYQAIGIRLSGEDGFNHSYGRRDMNSAKVSLTAYRCLIGRSVHSGEWRQESWATPEDVRTGTVLPIYPLRYTPVQDAAPDVVNKVMPESLPFYTYSDRGERTNLYIPYTETQWQLLEDLKARIRTLNERIQQVVSEPELTTLAALLNPAPALPAGGTGLLALPAPAGPQEGTGGAADGAKPRVACPGLADPADTSARADAHRAAPPCCDRMGEYNGFSSGPVIFECPKDCPCHD